MRKRKAQIMAGPAAKLDNDGDEQPVHDADTMKIDDATLNIKEGSQEEPEMLEGVDICFRACHYVG